MGNRAEYRDDHVVVKGNARQRLYDPSGYGRPHDEGDGVDLSFVEAGYLLSKGKIESVEGDGFGSFVDRVSYDGFLPTYHVYSDLRERGYYLQHPPGEDAVLLYPRGEKPSESSYSDRIEVLDESSAFPATDLLNTDMFAVVDQEDDVTYFELSDWSEEGDTPVPEPGGPLGVDNLDVDFRDGVYVLRDYPDEIHRTAFYGTPFDDELRLSTVEAADLWSRGLFGNDVRRPDTSGREPEAEVYTRLRDRGLCPRTGFKFGTDFRVYGTVEDTDDLPHSEYLVDVVDTDRVFSVSEISRVVRLANGVRKTLVLAVVDGSGGVRDEAGTDTEPDFVALDRHRP